MCKRMHRTRRTWGEKVAQEEGKGVGAGKSFLKLVQVALKNKKMPDTFHPILLMNMGWSTPEIFLSHSDSVFQVDFTQLYKLLWFVLVNMVIVPRCLCLPFCPKFFFFLIVYKTVRMETLNKNSMFIHLYRVLFLVSSFAHSRWFLKLNTLTLGKVAKASAFPEGFH